jgi:type IV secretion system protein VirB10
MDSSIDSRATDVDAATGVTQGTDVHRSKIPADDPRLRLDRPTPRVLRRGPVLAVAIALGALLAGGLVFALAGSSRETDPKKGQAEAQASTTPVPLPDVIKDPPSASNAAGGGAAPSRARPHASQEPAAAAANTSTQLEITARQARDEELSRARAASLFAAADDAAPVSQLLTGSLAAPDNRGTDMGTAALARPAAADPARPADPNLQERKNDFLARAGVSDAEYLEKAASGPRSPFEVKAGSVIPTALITGINSDLPGQVVAQVRENVYDTVTGNYLLIPQGSRLLAAYDSMVSWGQQRVLVCWNRLIRPDGSSITLDCMPGTDLAGYSGFSDQVDNHWWRIIGGAVVSSFLAATAQRSQGNVTGYQPSFPQVWATGAAGSINESGQQITGRNLQIQPTITVRPGFSVNVLVTRDIVIAPYVPDGSGR